jgi:hypothetical protein
MNMELVEGKLKRTDNSLSNCYSTEKYAGARPTYTKTTLRKLLAKGPFPKYSPYLQEKRSREVGGPIATEAPGTM